ncbi:ribonuclease H-like domain-containing protein [Aspergillus recurvatus]
MAENSNSDIEACGSREPHLGSAELAPQHDFFNSFLSCSLGYNAITPNNFGMELKALSSNWKRLQETLKKDVSTPPAPKRKRSDRETQNDLVKKRKTAAEAGKGNRAPQTVHISKKQERMSQRATDAGASATQNSNAVLSRENEGRSQNVDIGKYIAMDCEMVGIGPDPDNDSALARISIVNYNGDQVYDSYVRPKEMVTDWRTHVSGILPKHMAEARSLEQVQKEVAEILEGRILVGHALRNDLDALLLSHPKRDIRDTSKHTPYRKIAGGGSPRLKILASEFLGLNIQAGAHSSVEDAKATMLLYRRDKDEFEREHLKKWPVRVPPESKENGGDEKKKKKKKKKKTRKR